MRSIYKHRVPTDGSVSLPTVTKWLCVDIQHSEPQVWAVVDVDEPVRSYHLSVFGTGHQWPDDYDGEFIGTFQLENGALVFHVFVDAD